MDLKILCPCGQKFAFEVEPVNGEMPQPVECPACGADSTGQANALIRQALAASAPAPTAPVVRVRLSTSETPHATGPTTDIPQPPPPRPIPSGRPRVTAPVAAPAPAEDKESWLAFAKSAAWIVVVSLVAFYACVARVRRQMRFATEADKITAAAFAPWTLPDDDGMRLLVKGTNDAAVVQLTVNYWRDVQKKSLTPTRVTTAGALDSGRFVVNAPKEGVITIDGPLLWEEADATALAGLAQYLSQNLNTMTVSASMGDDAESGRFAIFDKGQRVFACDRRIRFANNTIVEDVKLEGQPWAIATGYKPREESWPKFTMYDADGLVQHLGFKPHDYAETDPATVLREPRAR
ncbi:MAG TPA: hypothetical protein PLX89_19035 [Verrucomicrobiota bacterium]|nr:hypothetical protein [Verrucomicrobiales bacterium]HRI15096.1 hypothetical protein [Verrucomicrobiota bacterium]